MQKPKIKTSVLILILTVVMLLGTAMLCYPLISSWYAERTKSEIKTKYLQTVESTDEDQLQKTREQAEEYNRRLLNTIGDANAILKVIPDYDSILQINGSSVIGYISIPKINVDLPIYHGVSEEALAHGAGHMPTSSFPIGGVGTHAAISAHTGTASDKLFTNLDQLEIGDVFYLTVLSETMAYEVDQIKIVLPTQTEDLQINPDKDLVTLITCTPYGVNTHRLLVRGHRIELDTDAADNVADTSAPSGSTWSAKYLQGILIGICLSIGSIELLLLVYRMKKREEKAK